MPAFQFLSRASLAIAVIAGSAIGSFEPANARDGRQGAFFGGLAAGAIVGGVIANSSRGYGGSSYNEYGYGSGYRYDSGYGYGYGARSYYQPSADYHVYESYEEPVVHHCYRQRQPIVDDYGEVVGYRRVRVCN